MTIEQQIADSLATIKALEDRRRDAITMASAGYDIEIRRECDVLDALKAAQSLAISDAVTHPREGERVWRMEMVYIGEGSWRRPSDIQRRIEGIVEVCRVDTVFAANIRDYSRPNLGTAFVRAIKKDGTTGIAIHSKTLTDEWKSA
jgi:hypothetical protein